MEANFFRSFFQELEPVLIGKRIEKIYEPLPGVLNCKFGTGLFLIMLPSPKRGGLFFTSSQPENPLQPSTRVQWLRKRLQNRKVLSVRTNWPQRRAAFELTPGQGNWLLFDLQLGLEIVDALDEAFQREPEWPSLTDSLTREDVYREYPQLTPPLRKTLASLPTEQAHLLFSALKQGQPEQFSVCWKKGSVWTVVPWAFPQTLANVDQVQHFERACQAAECFGRSLFREKNEQQEGRGRLYRRAVKRIEKNLESLQLEKIRLQRLCDQKETAELLQSVLYTLDGHSRLARVEVSTSDGAPGHVELDARYSVLENMEAMFKRAKKGKRGLEQVAKRQKELRAELEKIHNHSIEPEQWNPPAQRKKPQSKSRGTKKYRNIPLHHYETSEGFPVLQGKNQKANHQLLTQVARPFDYWFHAQDGPGAHVVLRREFKDQPVSRQSMLEAAVLAGAAGYQSQAEKAKVICALVKHVHPVKGLAPGQVRVDFIAQSFVVPLHSGLQNRIKKVSS